MKRVQKRCVAAAPELLAERVPELLELFRARKRGQERAIRKPLLQFRLVDRNAQGAEPDRIAGARVAQCGLHRAEVAVGGAHEQNGDLLPLEAVRHDELVGAFDERLVGRA